MIIRIESISFILVNIKKVNKWDDNLPLESMETLSREVLYWNEEITEYKRT